MNGCRARLFSTLLLSTLLAAPLDAGFIKIWQLKETAAAPILVVGRVVSVAKKERIPEGALPWKAETWAMNAEVKVLRASAAPGKAIAAGTILVRYQAYGPSLMGMINGSPPPLPFFEPGKVLLLPLRENPQPGTEPWGLIAESGMQLTIPVRGEFAESGADLGDGRNFVLREVAHTLSRGNSGELSVVSRWLANQQQDLAGELLPLLDRAIGNDRQRWAEIAAMTLASEGKSGRTWRS